MEALLHCWAGFSVACEVVSAVLYLVIAWYGKPDMDFSSDAVRAAFWMGGEGRGGEGQSACRVIFRKQCTDRVKYCNEGDRPLAGGCPGALFGQTQDVADK